MRIIIATAALIALATPAFAQFPPPGIYACTNVNGGQVGTLSLLVAGDYQFDDVLGKSSTGQISSAGSSVEALNGALGDKHWSGDFTTEAGKTTFVFKTDDGQVSCKTGK